MQPKNKTKVKAIYDFLQKITKLQKKILQPHPEAKLTINYYISHYNGDFELDVDTASIIAKGELKKFFNIANIESDDIIDDFDYEKYIDVDQIEADFNILMRKADIDTVEYSYLFNDCEDICWNDFWKYFSSNFDDPTKPKPYKPKPIRLNSSYNAIIDKDGECIKVGCQTVPIHAVREIIEEYDKMG
jgi:hypothetical protein